MKVRRVVKTRVLRPRVSVRVLNVDPHDVLVIECEANLSMTAVEAVRRHVRNLLPNNKVMVLAGGLQLTGVLREPLLTEVA